MLSGENLKAFLVGLWTLQGCPLSPLFFDIVLEVQDTAIREEKEIKEIQIRKKEVKLSLFADDVIAYTENPKEAIIKPLELINNFRKVAEYKINIQKSIASLYTDNKTSEIKEAISFTITLERIKHLRKKKLCQKTKPCAP